MCKPALYWIPNKNGCHSLCMGPPAWVDQCTSILQWKTQLKKKPGVVMSVRGWDTCRATLEQFPALGALLCSHPGLTVPSSQSPSLLTPWALGARSWVQQGSYTTVLNLPAEGLDLEREQIHTFPEEKLNEQLLLFDRVKWKPWLLNVCIRCNPSAAPFQKSPALSFTLWARPLVAILSNSESPSKELESVMI